VRMLLLVVALVLSGLSHAFAQLSGQMITCWYNANGEATGSDSAQIPATLGLTERTKIRSDNHYFSFNIWTSDGTRCPPKIMPAATKFCSPGVLYSPTTPVPFTGTIDDCVKLSVFVGGSSTQLGCLFGTGQSKFSLGQLAPTPFKPSPPDQNCGW
jgi:hypothetical protein